MKKTLAIVTALNIAVFSNVYCIPGSLLFDNNKSQHIFVNNRVVANVHGKVISIVDVMKKMDLLFYRRFPQYASSVEARYQFYQVNWRHILSEIIEKELILADAEECKIPISNGDIRQEMEDLFGPNIVANLDKAGLTFEEAWELVKEELIMNKMMNYRVNAKAVRSVTPQDIQKAYEEYAKNNRTPDKWCYKVITIRGEDPVDCAETANTVFHLLTEKDLPDEFSDKIQDYITQQTVKSSVNVSNEYTHTEKEVSDTYKEILSTLQAGGFSKPIAQKSKSDQSLVFRIIYLKEFIQGGVPPFSEMEMNIKNKMIEAAVQKEGEQYLTKLKKHFNIHEGDLAKLTPDEYQPFVLK